MTSSGFHLDIDPQLLKQAREYAAAKGKTLQEVVTELLVKALSNSEKSFVEKWSGAFPMPKEWEGKSDKEILRELKNKDYWDKNEGAN